MKLNSTNKNTLKAIVIVFALICILQFLRTSGSSPVTIETTHEGSLFDLESKEDCLKNSYYSDSKGGICGGQKLVAAQAGYKMK